MRADAQRRRAALVDAAARLFAAHGAGIALDAIADEAGVGIATLYRNFPSRAELVEEVALSRLERMRAATDVALERIERSPEAAWAECLDGLVALELGAIAAALAEVAGEGLTERVALAQRETLARLERLLAAARAAGLVRDDLAAIELVVGLGAISRPQPAAVERLAPALRERLVRLFVDGLRPPGR